MHVSGFWHRLTSRAIVAIVLLLSGTSVADQEAFRLELDGLAVQAQRVITGPHSRLQDIGPDGVWLIPQVRVHSSQRLLILERYPVVLLRKAVADDGVDLLDAGLMKPEPSRTIPPSVSPFVLPRHSQYGERNRAHEGSVMALSRFSIDRLPAGFRRLEGEVSLRIVTSDAWREVCLDGVNQPLTLVPGVTLDIKRDDRTGLPSRICFGVADELKPDEQRPPTPILNFVDLTEYAREETRTTYAVPIRGSTHRGVRDVRRHLLPIFQRQQPFLAAHIILDTREVRLPFVFTDVPLVSKHIESTQPYHIPLPEDQADPQAESSIGIRLEPLATYVMVTPSPKAGESTYCRATVRLKLHSERKTSQFSEVFSVVITGMSDESGRPFGNAGLVTMTRPRDAPTYLTPYWTPGIHGRSGMHDILLTFPCDSLPRRIGRFSGLLGIQEVTSDIRKTIDVDDSGKWIELGAGLEAIILRPEDEHGDDPSLSDMMVVRVRGVQGYPFSRRGNPETLPIVNNVQPLDLLGFPCCVQQFVTFTSHGPSPCIEIKWRPTPDTSLVRIHVVTAVRNRVVPFEFTDLPLTSP
ncbi:MAG: hypothetical protein ACK4WH_02810 [Phycisphaerales bacterium]